MIHVTIFGGHEGRLQPNKRFYLTLFGACELVRPTIARQLLAQRQADGENRSTSQKTFFLTAFGGAEIKCPTLSEEFLDLQEMINSGVLSLAEWEHSMATLARSDSTVASFTIFGGFDECTLPKEEEEIDSLAVQRHLGNIPESAGYVLQFGIGQRGAERTATLRRAIMAGAA